MLYSAEKTPSKFKKTLKYKKVFLYFELYEKRKQENVARPNISFLKEYSNI